VTEVGVVEALGRSRGGLTTKIHALTETNGNLVHFCLTGGQTHDCPPAKDLLEGIVAGYVIGDRAYDSRALVEQIDSLGAEAVIPSQSSRKSRREYDRERYKNRNRIERFFNRLKHFRRIATRYDKLDLRYAAFVLIVAAIIWGTM
jgi:transposase